MFKTEIVLSHSPKRLLFDQLSDDEGPAMSSSLDSMIRPRFKEFVGDFGGSLISVLGEEGSEPESLVVKVALFE